ncbi:leucine rich adaptor protein 1-like [Gracilinanus agilis]|uniref:leucine rich adaptor protein 1-like n=1 Tax=Gracilinanus agilis TaxID=191870 RepID=UPI001CFE592F|nr:leucine rich adaptor protein 1-like [Gracilinanus agilis]
MEESPLPDLRDIELKLGRKVPESLVRSLRGEEPGRDRDRDKDKDQGRGCSSSSSNSSSNNSCSLSPSSSSSSSSSPASGSPRCCNSSALERLETKLHLLKQEMVSNVLRSRSRQGQVGPEEQGCHKGERREEGCVTSVGIEAG